MGNSNLKRLTDKYVFDDSREIGKGAFGKVYVGYRRALIGTGKKVAVKKIDLEKMFGNPQLIRNEKEILQKCSQLNHPNLIKILDYAEHINEEGLGYVYIVMEFCEGGSLEDLISKKRENNQKFTEKEAIGIGLQIFRGLSVLHGGALQITHRDIKPENIMLSKGV